MAFTGTPAFKQISDNMVRITGLSLAASAVGTIGLHGTAGSPNVTLPATFQPKPYSNPYSQAVALQDSIDFEVKSLVAVVGQTAFSVGKAGTTAADFVGTITNTYGTGSDSLEIYVRFHQ